MNPGQVSLNQDQNQAQQPVASPPVSTYPSLSPLTSTPPVPDNAAGSVPPGTGWQKEAEPITQSELTHLIELHHDHELEPEVEGWVEKLERSHDAHLQDPVVHDNQVLVAQPTAQVIDDQIILPLTFEEVERGLQYKMTDSVRWLAEWCLRLSKMFGNRVHYRSNS